MAKLTHIEMIRAALETVIACAPEVAPEARFALRLFNELVFKSEVEPDEYNIEWLLTT